MNPTTIIAGLLGIIGLLIIYKLDALHRLLEGLPRAHDFHLLPPHKQTEIISRAGEQISAGAERLYQQMSTQIESSAAAASQKVAQQMQEASAKSQDIFSKKLDELKSSFATELDSISKNYDSQVKNLLQDGQAQIDEYKKKRLAEIDSNLDVILTNKIKLALEETPIELTDQLDSILGILDKHKDAILKELGDV